MDNYGSNPHAYDDLLVAITDYVFDYKIVSDEAFATASLCLADSLGCAMLALTFPACKKLLGPWVPGETITNGARVPGTTFELDPIKAAFDIGTMIRWLDYNDTWLAKEWGHPSDNLGAILSVMDFVTRRTDSYQNRRYIVQDVLDAMIRCYEIQGILALGNSFNTDGLDHVLLVKLASCALSTKLLGGDKSHILAALSQVFVDGQSLRTYRHAPNVGSRKSWAAGDATSRAVRLALITLQGELGYPSCITTPRWGFSDVLHNQKTVDLVQPFGSYVMENVLFKVAFPAEFHAQTAVEAALSLQRSPQFNVDNIRKIRLQTHEAAMRIINKTGPLHNPADRDHCLQYMVAVALITGELTADSYEDKAAANPQIDVLRDKMEVTENHAYSVDYLDPHKRSIANTVQIEFNDGSTLSKTVEYPIGHKRRRPESIPLVWEKFTQNLSRHYPQDTVQKLRDLMQSSMLLNMPIDQFMKQWLTY